MGDLSRVDVEGYCRQFHCRRFFETGTGLGAGLGHALTFPFLSLHSVEYEYELFRHGIEHFRKHPEPRVHLYYGTSLDILGSILPTMPKDDPILFWLDAHFPGADFGIRPYDAEWNDDIRVPEITELQCISEHRPNGRDVIVVDDARIWCDGPFELGEMPLEFRRLVPTSRSVLPLTQIMHDTHCATVSYKDHGYIIMTPRS